MKKRFVPVLAALFLVSALGTAFLVRLRPEPPPPVVRHPTVQRVAEATHHLDTLLQPVPAAAAAGPQTLRVSEDDMNVYLAGSPVARRLLRAHGIQAAQVILSPPASLSLRAKAQIQGQPRLARIDGVLTPDAGQGLRFTVTRAQISRLLLPPAAATQQAQKIIRAALRRTHRPLPLTVQSVRVVDKTLLITGLPNPPATPPAASPARR